MTSAVAGLRFRAAAPTDLDAVHAIELASFADPWRRESFDELLRQGRARMEVVEDAQNRVLGYSVAWLVADEAEIANLAVAADARGRGVGGALLDHLIADARRHGARAVFLEVRESNTAARALYTSRGFTVVGRRPKYYRKPAEDALVMRFGMR